VAGGDLVADVLDGFEVAVACVMMRWRSIHRRIATMSSASAPGLRLTPRRMMSTPSPISEQRAYRPPAAPRRPVDQAAERAATPALRRTVVEVQPQHPASVSGIDVGPPDTAAAALAVQWAQMSESCFCAGMAIVRT
jgi:hypothetical protein